jgi:hypothetical protein
MSVRLDRGVIALEGECHVEDAEHLAALLEAEADPLVDLAQCRHLHGALLQVLLWYRPRVTGAPADPFLRAWVVPILDTHLSRTEAQGS